MRNSTETNNHYDLFSLVRELSPENASVVPLDNASRRLSPQKEVLEQISYNSSTLVWPTRKDHECPRAPCVQCHSAHMATVNINAFIEDSRSLGPKESQLVRQSVLRDAVGE